MCLFTRHYLVLHYLDYYLVHHYLDSCIFTQVHILLQLGCKVLIFRLCVYSSCFTDVCCDDCNVLGGMVSLFHCVFMVFLWRPKENFSCNGHHSSSICKIFHVLQSMHLCHCKQKVSDPKLIMVYFMILAYYVAMERSSVKYNRLVKR